MTKPDIVRRVTSSNYLKNITFAGWVFPHKQFMRVHEKIFIVTKFLIIGLGNPGEEYTTSRHNIGWMIADELVRVSECDFVPDRYAFISDVRHKGRLLKVIKPTTYMNLSGKAVKYWMDKENIPIENILVISDDLDLDVGIIRIKKSGSGGSHNGLNNIIDVVGSSNFNRLRFGIGRNFPRGSQIEYVLGKFTDEEMKIIIPKISTSVEAIQSFVTAGADFTMTHYNNK